MNNLFPPISLTTSEMFELATAINIPVVQKYFHHLAVAQIKALAHGERKVNESAESYLERQAVVRGGLGAIEMLLGIEKPVQRDGE